MALDTGRLGATMDTEDEAATVAPTLDYGPDIGSALRAIRQARRMSLEKIGEQTRIKLSYLEAIEDMRLDDLPSRPFTLGYIRAYAQALGENPDVAADRFKASVPDHDEALQAPVGVSEGRDPRLAMVVGAGLVILVVIAGWNITQRLTNKEAPAVVENAAQPPPAPVAAPGAAVEIGAPLPPPTEATMPAPYVTPGLAAASTPAGEPGAASPATAPPVVAPPSAPARFTPRGEILGTRNAPVILQASRAGMVIVRRGDGSTAFADWLSVGQAYGATIEPGWSIEVSDPTAFNVYANGALTGPMPGFSAPLSRLAPPAPRPAPAAQRPAVAAPVAASAPSPVAPAPTPATPAQAQ